MLTNVIINKLKINQITVIYPSIMEQSKSMGVENHSNPVMHAELKATRVV